MLSYSEFVKTLMVSEPDRHHGGRKIFLNKHYLCTDYYRGKCHLSIRGYTSRKMNLLREAYFNEEDFTKALLEWENNRQKEDYSIGWHCHNKPKRTGQTGWCMQAMVVVQAGDYHVLNVFYRTVEIIKKFYADLCFIDQVIQPNFDIKFDEINFYFSSVTLNNLYLPMMLNSINDHRKIFDMVEKNDYRFFKGMTKWANDYLSDRPLPFSEMRKSKEHVNYYNIKHLEYLASKYQRR